MTRLQGFPYLRPIASRIRITDWQLRADDDITPLPELLPHWDPAMPLHIFAPVEVDTAGVFADCMLHEDDHLRLAIVWQSLGTGLRGRGSAIYLDSMQSSQSTVLALSLEGGDLADRIRIDINLVLASAGKSDAGLAPHRPGSLLWHEERTVILEGQASRFPVELIDFTQHMKLPENGAWFLDWDPEDLHLMALGSIRLLINAGHDTVTRAVTQTLPQDASVRDAMRFEVGRTMITGALANDDFVVKPDAYEDGTIGAAIRRLIHTFFPGESIEGVRQLCQYDPANFECYLQDRFRLFQEV